MNSVQFSFYKLFRISSFVFFFGFFIIQSTFGHCLGFVLMRNDHSTNGADDNLNNTARAHIRRMLDKPEETYSRLPVKGTNLSSGDKNHSTIFGPQLRYNEAANRTASRKKRNVPQTSEDLFEFMVRIANTPTEWERIRRVLSRIKSEEDYAARSTGGNTSSTFVQNETRNATKNNSIENFHDQFSSGTDANASKNDFLQPVEDDDENYRKRTENDVTDDGWPSSVWIKRADDKLLSNLENSYFGYEQAELNSYDDYDAEEFTSTSTSSAATAEDEQEDFEQEEDLSKTKYTVISSMRMASSPANNDTFQLNVYKHVGPDLEDSLEPVSENAEYDAAKNVKKTFINRRRHSHKKKQHEIFQPSVPASLP